MGLRGGEGGLEGWMRGRRAEWKEGCSNRFEIHKVPSPSVKNGFGPIEFPPTQWSEDEAIVVINKGGAFKIKICG